MRCFTCGKAISGVSYVAPDGAQYCVECATTLPLTPSDPVSSRPDISTEVRFASFWRRITATLIDLPINLVIGVLVPIFTVRVLFQIGGWEPPSKVWDVRALWASFELPSKLFFVFAGFLSPAGVLYYALCHSSQWRATIGKRILAIQVTDYQLCRLSLMRAFGRELGKILLHLGGYLSPVSAITIALTRRKQGIHDFVCRTIVIRGRPALDAPFEYWRVSLFLGLTLAIYFAFFIMTLVQISVLTSTN